MAGLVREDIADWRERFVSELDAATLRRVV